MAKSGNVLEEVVARLEAAYGRPEPPPVTDPLELILLENVAYLVGDEQRAKAFEALRERVGVRPESILSAPAAVLVEVARRGGVHAEKRAERLREIALVALEEFGGDLGGVLKLPPAQAKRALKLFPAVGDPGAEKILLFTRSSPVLALDSNGLRVLIRLGFGEERKSYAATYRSAQDAVRDYLREDYEWLIRTHQLLRRHGQELCRRSEPACAACPLKSLCRYYQGVVAPGAGGRA
ncbi:MAG: hypothetical protein JOZ02_00535 [Acidobacteria bacterium]|nr:hypothetical protein [Acidobacteriota bacterium]